eukprot:TRINITY_DN64671_c0_g1_i1.p1 TRINITY_DN64671_c0_g1~~TRINITY_DN64671_c0_g1_i1.p1  ORF type:complete len:204 (+),score=40.26 TRINITY_DN64671_c0_g1_i1:76-687(+)
MALHKLSSELERALGEIGKANSALALDQSEEDVRPQDDAMHRAASDTLLSRRHEQVGTCSTTATSLASGVAGHLTPNHVGSGEVTPPLMGLQEGKELSADSMDNSKQLLDPPAQLKPLPRGTGHFLLGASCLKPTQGPFTALPLHQRVEAAEAAQASLQADLLGLDALKAPNKDLAQTSLLTAASLAKASLQSRGMPGASSSM